VYNATKKMERSAKMKACLLQLIIVEIFVEDLIKNDHITSHFGAMSKSKETPLNPSKMGNKQVNSVAPLQTAPE